MKKVLLHIATVLGAAGILICGLLLVPPFYAHNSLGFTETWKTAFAWSWLYLASFSIYFLSVRSLKRLGGRGLWIYGVLCFMAVVWFAYDMFWLSNRLLTLSVLLEFVVLVLLFLPVPLLPVLSSGQKGERRIGALFFSAFLVFTLSVLTHGYYKMGQGRLANQFDPWQHTDRVLASDAYASHKTGLLITVDEQGRAYAYVSYVPYDGSGVRHTEVFALSREADEIVLTKEFYSYRYQTEPDFSMPFYRGTLRGLAIGGPMSTLWSCGLKAIRFGRKRSKFQLLCVRFTSQVTPTLAQRIPWKAVGPRTGRGWNGICWTSISSWEMTIR